MLQFVSSLLCYTSIKGWLPWQSRHFLPMETKKSSQIIGRKLREICSELWRFAKFSLTIGIKCPSMVRGYQFKNDCSSYSSCGIDPAT